ERRELVHVDLAEAPADRIVGRRGCVEESELLIVPRGAAERRAASARQLVALETDQDLPGAGDHGGRQAGKARDLNPITTIGAAWHHLAQQHQTVRPAAASRV